MSIQRQQKGLCRRAFAGNYMLLGNHVYPGDCVLLKSWKNTHPEDQFHTCWTGPYKCYLCPIPQWRGREIRHGFITFRVSSSCRDQQKPCNRRQPWQRSSKHGCPAPGTGFSQWASGPLTVPKLVFRRKLQERNWGEQHCCSGNFVKHNFSEGSLFK